MTMFGWLFLGHFVADWLLQNDWMALGKRGLFTKPGLAHYAVYTAVILAIFAFVTPVCATTTSLLAVAAIIFLSHWLIDGADLAHRWMHCFGQRDQAMVRIVIDQTFHLLILGGVAAWCVELIGRGV